MHPQIAAAWQAYERQHAAKPPEALKQAFWQNLLTDAGPSFLKSLLGVQNADFTSLDAEDLAEAYAVFLARLDGERQRHHGIYYTPQPIAHYLTDRSLGRFLEDASASLQQSVRAGEAQEAEVILSRVQAIQILDPSCGAGVFLVEAWKRLAGFYTGAAELLPDFSLAGALRHAGENQLFGVDLDPVAVEIARLRLHACVPDQEVHFSSVRNADMLTEPVFGDGPRWDFILGNPPYVSEVRRQSEKFRPLKNAAQGYYRAKMDLCDAFLAWSLAHLNEDGQLAFVLPEYWTQRSSTKALRETLMRTGRIREFWRFGESRLFDLAPGHHTSLLIWQKGAEASGVRQDIDLGDGAVRPLCGASLQPAAVVLDVRTGKLAVGEPMEMRLLEKLSRFPALFQPHEIQQGVVLPQGRLKKNDWVRLPVDVQPSVPPDSGVFLLTEAEAEALQLTPAEWAWLKPYYLPSAFSAKTGFSGRAPDYWLIYGTAAFRQEVARDPQRYARLKAHLDRFTAINTSAFGPYGLHRARQAQWFEPGLKLFSPRQVMRPNVAVVPHAAYVNEGFYILRPAEMTPEQADKLVRILNSPLAWFWFYHQKRKGHRLQIDKDVLLAFPRPPEERPGSQIGTTNAQGREDESQGWESCVNRLYGLNEEESLYLRQWAENHAF